MDQIQVLANCTSIWLSTRVGTRTAFLELQTYPAHCQDWFGKHPQLNEYAHIKGSDLQRNIECNGDHRRKCIRLTNPYQSVVHINYPCRANEINSLVRRHLDNAEDHDSDVRSIWKYLYAKYPPQALRPLTYDEVIKHKPPSQRKRYRRALVRLTRYGLREKDCEIKMFIKNERMKYPNDDCTEIELKPPRAIQARGQSFNLVVQRYMIPYAKFFKDMRVYSGRSPFAKGMDPIQIAQQLLDDWDNMTDPVALLLDQEKFDSSLNTQWIKETHRYYRGYFCCDEIIRLLRVQLRNKCTTATGLRYVVVGTRMSGDPDTSDGNSTANLALICHLMRECSYRETVMGDDCVVIFERHHLPLIMNRLLEHKLNRTYPWKTTYRVTDVFEDIDFCQCKPVKTINGYIMVRDISRVITRGLTCISQTVVNNPGLYYDWLRAVGDCEYSCNPGVPVHSSVAKYMQSYSNRPIKEPQDKSEFKMLHGKYKHNITTEARLSYQRAFGIDINMQHRIEQWFEQNRGIRYQRLTNIDFPYPGRLSKILINE